MRFCYMCFSFDIVVSLVITKIVPFMLQLGIRPQNDDLTVDEAWDDLVGRIKYIFSDEVSLVSRKQFQIST